MTPLRFVPVTLNVLGLAFTFFSLQCASAQASSAQLASAQLASAQLASAQLASAQPALAQSAAPKIDPIGPQSLGLGATLSIPLTITGEGEIDLEVDPGDLAPLKQAGDLSFSLTPAHLSLEGGHAGRANLEIATRTSIEDFRGRAVSILAGVTDATDGERTRTDFNLTVLPTYLVSILDGTGGEKFGFSSPDQIAYFRPHSEGLIIRFQNLSSNECVIHGEGVIVHQPLETPLLPASQDSLGHPIAAPQGTYLNRPILPSMGSNLKGYYTLHEIYRPERHIIVNATRVP